MGPGYRVRHRSRRLPIEVGSELRFDVEGVHQRLHIYVVGDIDL